jgi:hypothetical protein
MNVLRSLLLLNLLLAACAEPGPASHRYDENDYVTGSNLPRRGSPPPEVRTVSKEAVDDWQRTRPGQMPTGMGR